MDERLPLRRHHACQTLHMQRPSARETVAHAVSQAIIPLTQMSVVAFWFLAALAPPSMMRVPDAVIAIVLPSVLSLLFLIGFVVMVRRPNAGLVIGTALCAITALTSLAISVLMPTSLPDF